MSGLKIVTLPDQILRTPCKPVKKVTPELLSIAKDMLEFMYKAPGVGLAANQVGLDIQLVVIDPTRDPEKMGKNSKILFNPKIIESSGKVTLDEGCLSLPGIFENVTRKSWVKVSYLNEKNEEKIIEGSGLLAQVIQHEIDHLNGKLYIDLLSPLKRNFILKKYRKNQKRKDESE